MWVWAKGQIYLYKLALSTFKLWKFKNICLLFNEQSVNVGGGRSKIPLFAKASIPRKKRKKIQLIKQLSCELHMLSVSSFSCSSMFCEFSESQWSNSRAWQWISKMTMGIANKFAEQWIHLQVIQYLKKKSYNYILRNFRIFVLKKLNWSWSALRGYKHTFNCIYHLQTMTLIFNSDADHYSAWLIIAFVKIERTIMEIIWTLKVELIC